jgi:UDP-glucose:(heptosyl)LPS alpha-1,3-glucosyltransferase
VQIGSGFKTKGLDRSLRALAALPAELRARTRLIAIGQDEPVGLPCFDPPAGPREQRVEILKGRDDIPRFLLGADLLIHPAYNENTGTVLLEAVVAGLPVLTTAVCGYAHYIEDAEAGRVLPLPFAQAALDARCRHARRRAERGGSGAVNGLAFAETADLYSNAERAADMILRAAP